MMLITYIYSERHYDDNNSNLYELALWKESFNLREGEKEREREDFSGCSQNTICSYLFPEVKKYQGTNNHLLYEHHQQIDKALGQPVMELEWFTFEV